jgi:hypothetical protein
MTHYLLFMLIIVGMMWILLLLIIGHRLAQYIKYKYWCFRTRHTIWTLTDSPRSSMIVDKEK